MVKGVSRQVIVVPSPDKKLFDQAIFILSDQAAAGEGVTDDQLLKEAQRAVRGSVPESRRKRLLLCGPVWACTGAAITGLAWLISWLV